MSSINHHLRRHKVIALDTSCFIYVFAEHPQFFPAAFAVLDYIRSGKARGIVSVITVTELLYRVGEAGDKKLRIEYETSLEGFPNLNIAPVTLEVAKLTADLRYKYKIATPDAIHLATAIQEKAGLFVTNDNALKKIKEINILLLKDL